MANMSYITDSSKNKEDERYYFGYVVWNGIPMAKKWCGMLPEKNAVQVVQLWKEKLASLDELRETYPYNSVTE